MASGRTLGLLVLAMAVLIAGMYAVKMPAAAEANRPEPIPNTALSGSRVLLPPVPDSLTFCGERVPLERPEVRERLERELLDNTHKISQTLLILKRAGRWQPILSKTLLAQGAPADLFYLAVAESELANARSRVGAQGFWQFMPETARSYGLVVTKEVDERDNPLRSAEAAIRFLGAGYARHTSWALAAAGYNMGPGRVTEALAEQGASSYYELALNRETQRYVYRILALKCILESPDRYGFVLPDSSRYQPTRCRIVTVRTPVEDLQEFARQNGTTYPVLRLYNPWLKANRLPVEEGKSYTLYIPDSSGKDIMGLVTE